MEKLELWADSFHEGDWAGHHLLARHKNMGRKGSVRYESGFIPIFTFDFPAGSLELTVYGSYRAWNPLPAPIEDLLGWGKPDLIGFDPKRNEIIFAAEETAAVPTGNQALQRCERLYGSSRAKIPFWYLLPEYGLHKDEGLRRDSIWPTVMALKLSLHNETPSVILHYADRDNPEGYDFGNGVDSLFEALYKIIENRLNGFDSLAGLERTLTAHYSDMLRFLKAQYRNIIQHLPGLEYLDEKDLASGIVEVVCGGGTACKEAFFSKYISWLIWPNVSEWRKSTSNVGASELIKHDGLAALVEAAINNDECYVISSNAGSKPQKRNSLSEWIQRQNATFAAAAAEHKLDAILKMDLADFPSSKGGHHHVTTAKNILYIFDHSSSLYGLICEAYPRLAEKLPELQDYRPAIFYISNSIKPGRLFGDPFTGQISAYSVAFGKLDPVPRRVIAYFPHQSFSQFLDSQAKLVKNKGFVLMRELVDVVILGGGVAVKFNAKGRAFAV